MIKNIEQNIHNLGDRYSLSNRSEYVKMLSALWADKCSYDLPARQYSRLP